MCLVKKYDCPLTTVKDDYGNHSGDSKHKGKWTVLVMDALLRHFLHKINVKQNNMSFVGIVVGISSSVVSSGKRIQPILFGDRKRGV